MDPTQTETKQHSNRDILWTTGKYPKRRNKKAILTTHCTNPKKKKKKNNIILTEDFKTKNKKKGREHN